MQEHLNYSLTVSLAPPKVPDDMSLIRGGQLKVNMTSSTGTRDGRGRFILNQMYHSHPEDMVSWKCRSANSSTGEVHSTALFR